jgi:hypothetical protein
MQTNEKSCHGVKGPPHLAILQQMGTFYGVVLKNLCVVVGIPKCVFTFGVRDVSELSPLLTSC